MRVMTVTARIGSALAQINHGRLTSASVSHSHPPLIPDDVRMRGVQISPLFSEIDTPDEDLVLSAMWRVWDWAGRIKPQIDDAATVANCVRMFGNTHVVTSGNISLSTYLERWQQFFDYCVTKNLYVYPCGGDLFHWGADTTYTAATTIFSAWADLMAGYANIIGVDIINEAWYHAQFEGPTCYKGNQPEPYLDLLHHLGSIVRRRANMPITNSMYVNAYQPWLYPGDDVGGPITPLFDLSDFIDIHVYLDGSTPQDAANMLQTPWGVGKQMIFGEFGGLSTESSSAVRTARYEETQDIVTSRDDICGALAWACWDAGTDDGQRWGLFNPSRVLRTDISVPFATLPTTR